MSARQSLISSALVAWCVGACAKPVPHNPTPPLSARQTTRGPELAVSWGIPRFFEFGRRVRLEPGGALIDTTGWPAAIVRAPDGAARAYLSEAFDDRSKVFLYPELDVSQRARRYALVVPEPKSFSTNGVVTAFWGQSPLLMNFALGPMRSFGTFTRTEANGVKRVIPLRARVQPGGVNPQELENVYELEDSRLDVFEHKGLVPGEPLSFLEFTVYDRDSTPDDQEPSPVPANAVPNSLEVGLIPLREEAFSQRRSFESNGYRVVLGSDASGQSYFLATPNELQPGWGFSDVSTDLTLGQLQSIDSGAGSAAALELRHAPQGWLLCGVVRDPKDIPLLLQRGTEFRTRLQSARRELTEGAISRFAGHAARAFLDAHRSHRDPRTITAVAHGDARQPANSIANSAGLRYGRDLASALIGLASVQQASKDPALLKDLASLAEAGLAAQTASGATLARHFEELALVAEHDPRNGRSDAFIENGALAVAFNHRRLLIASAETHQPSLTWGGFGATIDGQSANVDEARYEFSVEGGSVPRVVSSDDTKLSVSRLFTPDTGTIRIRETAQLERGSPAVAIDYQLENRGDRAATLTEARITLADFLEYGTGENESSQSRYGLGHVADGVRLPIGFWMEGMKTPIWGDSLPAGALDLTEQYKSLGARFLLVYGFDRAQLYFLARPADRLMLYNGENGVGLSRLEVRYQAQVTLDPHQSYELPRTLSYTLRAPLQSADGDGIPDQLQELAPLWARIMSSKTQAGEKAPSSLDTDSGHAALVYAWSLAADLLTSGGAEPALIELAERLRASAMRGASFALTSFSELHNRSDWLPTYANGHDYGFHLAVFDWAYRETCDVRYREAFLSLADDLARPDRQGGLQISAPNHPSYGGYLSTQQARASGATRVGDQGLRLWALRIAYERTGQVKYRRSAELFVSRWLRLDPEARSFTGTVFADRRYRDADIEQERSPLGHYAVLAGLRAWSDILPTARELYATGLAMATKRQLLHGIGFSGPHRLLAVRQGLADFTDDAEIGGTFLWATTFDPRALRGRFAGDCRRRALALESAADAH